MLFFDELSIQSNVCLTTPLILDERSHLMLTLQKIPLHQPAWIYFRLTVARIRVTKDEAGLLIDVRIPSLDSGPETSAGDLPDARNVRLLCFVVTTPESHEKRAKVRKPLGPRSVAIC